MTFIYYSCIDSNGNERLVLTLDEAKELVRTYGGSYELKYSYREMKLEAFCRVGARMPGHHTR